MSFTRATILVLLVGATGSGYLARRWHRHHRGHRAAALAAPRPGPIWQPPPLEVPRARPRLWWTPERLARGRAWAKRNPLHPRDDDPADEALAYLLAGDRAAGHRAVDWLLSFTVATDAVASDQARWNGESAMLVFDWCHDLLNPTQRQTLIDRWNTTLDALDKKTWGGVGMEANNYYWGYLRNDIEWGVASANENPRAPEFLRHGLDTRFGRSFVPFASGPGRGGALTEGSQYGPYLLAYATLPLVTMANLGVDMWSSSNFFREAVYALIYATTPGPTTPAGGTHGRYELFPFDDDEKFLEGGSAERSEPALFMEAAAERWRTSPVGQYARAWLDMVNPAPIPIVASWQSATPVPARPFAGLPLDYYAPGPGFFYARNAWGSGASVAFLQLGMPDGVGHQHVDWGTFQLWRGGRWLSRESVGYGEQIAGWGGPGEGRGGSVGSESALAHNTVLFEGMGPRNAGNRRGGPRILRVESRPDYAYAAVDLGDSYRCSLDECRPERDDNPYAAGVVREFLYLRPLATLVTFDRLTASGESKSAAEVVKTFVLHTENRAAIDGNNRLLTTNGREALRDFTLLPTAETPRIVAEGGKVGQYRVEIDTKGAALSYFLNVLQARGVDDPDLRASLQEGDDDFTVRIVDPTRGAAIVVFKKGSASRGGQVGYAASGAPVAAPLGEGVQGISVSDAGPRWQ